MIPQVGDTEYPPSTLAKEQYHGDDTQARYTPGIGSDNTKSLNPALKPAHQERAKHASLNGAET